ncbi:stage III sporulation protein AE [Tissierella sp. MSJ-40]|uniref:Stage III sporulation protein AE n=1 Tax=Tissierella simiarum TaxID=2841534 RepID=A0ABS6E405_9FIRM|nr:stage III sporulation protein AE [Tissierella simiarum]MBU5437546.1 stage III sporulation protein AE [Tissierella simiarum]
MKKTCILILIIIIILFSNSCIADEENLSESIIDQQMESLNISELEELLQDIINTNEILPKIDVKDFLGSLIKGKVSLDGKSIGRGVSLLFFNEIINNLSLISKILIITLISSLLTNLQNTFDNESIAQIANYVTYILIIMLVINSYSQVISLGKQTTERMVNFMQIILPILLTLLTATGGPNTKLLFHPIVIATVNIIGALIKDLIFPLIFFSFIIGMISNLSQRLEFNKLSELSRQVITFAISASLTIFIGIITMYGITSKIDGITIRTAKFAVDKFIPIIGSFLSDAVETVVGCSAILKNGIGAVGLLTLFFICIAPIIKIVVLLFVYKLIAAVIQPVASSNIVECFSQVSKSLLLILVSVLSTATMFFITITIIVEAGNAALMLR